MNKNLENDLDAQIAQLQGIDLSQAVDSAPTKPISPVQPQGTGVQPVNTKNEVDPALKPPISPVGYPQNTGLPPYNPVQPQNVSIQPQNNSVQPSFVNGVAGGVQTFNQPVQPQPVQPQPVQPQPVQPQPVQPQNNIVQSGIDYKALNKRPVFVDLNRVNKTRTPFLSVKKGEYARVILFTLNSLRDHIHYIDGLGTIRCLSHYNENDYPDSFAACCTFPTDDGKPNYAKRRQLIPVLKLPVSPQDGKTIVGNNVELCMWNMNIMESQSLTQILKTYSPSDSMYDTDLTTFDLMLYKDPSKPYPVNDVTAVPTNRAPFNNLLQAEASKLTDEMWDIAWEEMAKVVNEEVIIQKANEAIALRNQVNMQMQNPQQPPTFNQALGFGN